MIPPAIPKPSSGKATAWPRMVCVGVSLLLLWMALRRVDLAQLRTALLRAQPIWWLAAFLAFGAACFLGALRWRLMLGLKTTPVPLPACLRATLAGHFLNTLLFGPAGGDIVKSLLFGRWHRRSTADILVASWLDRLVAGIGSALFAALLLGLVDWRQLPEFKMQFPRATLIKLVPIIVVLAIVVGVFLSRRYKNSFVPRTVDRLRSGLKKLVAAPRLAIGGILLGLLVQVHLSSVLMLCLRSVTETSPDWLRLFWTFPVISLFTALPISVAGVGVREGSSILLLGLFGVPAVDAVAASLLALVCSLAWAGFGGLALAWEENHQKPK